MDMIYRYIDKSKITVKMSMKDYEYYLNAEKSRNYYDELLKRANKDGKAVMTNELKTAIEEIYM